MSKRSIYTCPHCGEKTFNPITKAFAGGLNSRGRACKACGKHCCNGQVSTIVSAVIYVIALAGVIFFYLGQNNTLVAYVQMGSCVLGAYILTKVFDAFFMPLVRVIRNDVRS